MRRIPRRRRRESLAFRAPRESPSFGTLLQSEPFFATSRMYWRCARSHRQHAAGRLGISLYASANACAMKLSCDAAALCRRLRRKAFAHTHTLPFLYPNGSNSADQTFSFLSVHICCRPFARRELLLGPSSMLKSARGCSFFSIVSLL